MAHSIYIIESKKIRRNKGENGRKECQRVYMSVRWAYERQGGEVCVCCGVYVDKYMGSGECRFRGVMSYMRRYTHGDCLVVNERISGEVKKSYIGARSPRK